MFAPPLSCLLTKLEIVRKIDVGVGKGELGARDRQGVELKGGIGNRNGSVYKRLDSNCRVEFSVSADKYGGVNRSRKTSKTFVEGKINS